MTGKLKGTSENSTHEINEKMHFTTDFQHMGILRKNAMKGEGLSSIMKAQRKTESSSKYFFLNRHFFLFKYFYAKPRSS